MWLVESNRIESSLVESNRVDHIESTRVGVMGFSSQGKAYAAHSRGLEELADKGDHLLVKRHIPRKGQSLHCAGAHS